MAKNIHPAYHQIEITCSTCKNKFTSGSTKEKGIVVDICSQCHPFYNGKSNFARAKGRIEMFRSKMSKKEQIQTKVKTASAAQIEKNKTQQKAKASK